MRAIIMVAIIKKLMRSCAHNKEINALTFMFNICICVHLHEIVQPSVTSRKCMHTTRAM